MRPANALHSISSLLKQPYFTSREVRDVGIDPSILSHYIKTGRLRRIHRGLYQSVTYSNPLAFRWEDLVEAVYSVKGGVVCLTSALAIYDLTEEIPRQHWIAIRHGTSVKTDGSLKIVRYREMHLGKIEVEVEGVVVPIFDRERTIVDAFRMLSRETAIKALKAGVAKVGKERIDLNRLQEYAKRLRVNIIPYLMSVTT